jgi:peptidoglycan/LPS O-acetylase OafA/YrhL
VITLSPRLTALARPPWDFLCSTGALIAVAAALILGRLSYLDNALLEDYFLAFSFALLVYVILHQRQVRAPGWYSRTARLLSSMSYTLYLGHLPALVCLAACLGVTSRWQPDPLHLVAASGISAVVFVYALVLFCLCEARTDALRSWIHAKVLPGVRSAQART